MAQKKLTDKEILEALRGTNSTKFKKAVNHIEKNKLHKYAPVLLDVLKQRYEKTDGKYKAQYFETYEACMTLGALQYNEAIPILEIIAREPSAISGVGAGYAYIRLIRKDTHDFAPIFDFLEHNTEQLKNKKYGHTTMYSAFFTVSKDKMVPKSLEEQQKFIDYAWNCIDDYELENEGFENLGLIASSLAGFDKDLTKPILYKIYECGLVEKGYFQNFAKNALEGKYSHFNPVS